MIAQQIEEAMLGRRARLDTRAAEERAARARRFVVAERKLKERIGKLHERLLEARDDFHLSPDRISRAVRVALDLAELPSLQAASLTGVPEGGVFEVPMLPGSWGRATAGLEHPHTGRRRPITFDHEVAKGRDDVVLAHLNHKLVQMCLRLLRAEVWALEDLKRLHRVTVRAVPDAILEGPAVATLSRLVVTGGNHHRLHEELTLSGGELKHSGFTRITQVGRLEKLMEESRPIPSPGGAVRNPCGPLPPPRDFHLGGPRRPLAGSTEVPRKHPPATEGERDCRPRRGADRFLKVDSAKNCIGLNRISWKFGRQSSADQLRRDAEALRARLARLPAERERESAAIEARYAGLAD